MINPINVQELRKKVRSAAPFPFFVIDNFLDPVFARKVQESFPSYQDAVKVGVTFKTVNEKGKIQITDAARFAPPVLELNRLLAAPEWTRLLSEVFDIPDLLADDKLVGGGMHQTGSRGRLDVHVDFNYIPERQLHRRLNVLVYLNQVWQAEWGGNLELWDKKVENCEHSLQPVFNRCVAFETSDISYHGVTAVNCPPDHARQSFATYYYTKEAPAHWKGESHSTIFRSRPDEMIRGRVLMPAERAAQFARQSVGKLKRGISKIF